MENLNERTFPKGMVNWGMESEHRCLVADPSKPVTNTCHWSMNTGSQWGTHWWFSTLHFQGKRQDCLSCQQLTGPSHLKNHLYPLYLLPLNHPQKCHNWWRAARMGEPQKGKCINKGYCIWQVPLLLIDANPLSYVYFGYFSINSSPHHMIPWLVNSTR